MMALEEEVGGNWRGAGAGSTGLIIVMRDLVARLARRQPSIDPARLICWHVL